MLTDAIATAQGVANSSEATQQEVDVAVQALNTAIATFNEAIIIADPGVVKTALTVAITTAQNWVDTIATGTAPGQVSEVAKTALTEAIATAQGVANNSEATQQEVDAAVQALNTAITTFNEAIVADPGVGVVKTRLTVAIKTAQNWVDTIATGTAPGQVSEIAKTALTEAIETAQLVANNSKATQQEVDDAVQALKTAIATYNEAIIDDPGVVKTALTEAITTAQNLVNTTETGTAPGQVSEIAKTALTEAIATAKGVADNSEATQQELEVAVQALNTAITTFNEAIVKETIIYSVGNGANANEIVLTFSESIGTNGPIDLSGAGGTVADATAVISGEADAAGTILTISSTMELRDGKTVKVPLTIGGRNSNSNFRMECSNISMDTDY